MDKIERSEAKPLNIMDAAQMMGQGGLLPKGMSWQGAAWLMQVGSEYGWGPGKSMQLLYVVQNRVTLSADGAVALVMQAHPDWRFSYDVTDAVATVTVVDGQGEVRAKVTFSMEDAKRAGLLNKGGPWVQYPRNMLLARAKSMAARLAAPDAVGGLYSPEEMGAQTDTEGKSEPRVIEATVTEPDPEDDISQAVNPDGEVLLTPEQKRERTALLTKHGISVEDWKEWCRTQGFTPSTMPQTAMEAARVWIAEFRPLQADVIDAEFDPEPTPLTAAQARELQAAMSAAGATWVDAEKLAYRKDLGWPIDAADFGAWMQWAHEGCRDDSDQAGFDADGEPLATLL